MSYGGDGTPTGRMAGRDLGQGRGSPEDGSARAVVPYGGGPTPMEVDGSCPGGSEIQGGEVDNRPEILLLCKVGSAAAAAAHRATLLAAAEWTQRAENRTGSALRGMGEALGAELRAFMENQAAASQQHRGQDMLALQEGLAGRIASQEGAISAIGAGLEAVHQRAENQAHDFWRL